MFIIPAFRRLRQENHKFKSSQPGLHSKTLMSHFEKKKRNKEKKLKCKMLKKRSQSKKATYCMMPTI
jgi:hypothetical protein